MTCNQKTVDTVCCLRKNSAFITRLFEMVATNCDKFSDNIPISFVLGFYVQRVISRFWEQFQTIPWPNRMAIYVSTYLQTNDESGRLMRRTIMRYLCLAFVLTMSSISPPIKKRFPTLTHMTEAGNVGNLGALH